MFPSIFGDIDTRRLDVLLETGLGEFPSDIVFVDVFTLFLVFFPLYNVALSPRYYVRLSISIKF